SQDTADRTCTPTPPPPPPPPAPSAYPPPPPGAYSQPPAAPPPGAGYGFGQAAPGSIPPGTYYDQSSGLTLPQGVELASIGRRIGAFFLAIPLAIVTLVIGYAIWGLIVWGRGQTPTYQVLGMRVWHPQTGRAAGWGRMALREIVGRIVEEILGIITLAVSFILMITGKERKALHDHIAGTVALRDPNNVLAG
ncbi:MAG: RDD family protein, partial [Nitrososphaerales archaeon]